MSDWYRAIFLFEGTQGDLNPQTKPGLTTFYQWIHLQLVLASTLIKADNQACNIICAIITRQKKMETSNVFGEAGSKFLKVFGWHGHWELKSAITLVIHTDLPLIICLYIWY